MTTCFQCNLRVAAKIKLNKDSLQIVANINSNSELKKLILQTADENLLHVISVCFKNYQHHNTKFDEFDEKLLKKRAVLISKLAQFTQEKLAAYRELILSTDRKHPRLIPHVIGQFLNFFNRGKYHENEKMRADR